MAINQNPKCLARKPRPRIPSISKARHARLREYATLRKQFLHARPRCERCKKKSTDIHHKRGRVGRLLCMSEHWASVCRSCHNWIGENPKEARELGLLCELGKWNTP
jgi:hypothetical protein